MALAGDGAAEVARCVQVHPDQFRRRRGRRERWVEVGYYDWQRKRRSDTVDESGVGERLNTFWDSHYAIRPPATASTACRGTTTNAPPAQRWESGNLTIYEPESLSLCSNYFLLFLCVTLFVLFTSIVSYCFCLLLLYLSYCISSRTVGRGIVGYSVRCSVGRMVVSRTKPPWRARG